MKLKSLIKNWAYKLMEMHSEQLRNPMRFKTKREFPTELVNFTTKPKISKKVLSTKKITSPSSRKPSRKNLIELLVMNLDKNGTSPRKNSNSSLNKWKRMQVQPNATSNSKIYRNHNRTLTATTKWPNRPKLRTQWPTAPTTWRNSLNKKNRKKKQ